MRGRRLAAAIAAMMATTAVSGMTPAAAQTERTLPKRSFAVAASDAATGVVELGRQAGVQILIAEDVARGHRTNAVKGNYTVVDALGQLLANTGLTWTRTDAGTYVVIAQASVAQEDANIPEILVRGQREWSLNTGIQRTQNDSQPFIVLDRDAIVKSGAQTLEGLLRDQLNVNTAPGSSIQTGSAKVGRGSVNLRGLGDGQTLILVDGRRLPGANDGTGAIEQPSIIGIPLAAIERVEVLASSASGIYGAGATGGVVNIVLRRDYRGAEVAATLGGTYDGGGFERRIDASGSFALEGGRTKVSTSGTFRVLDPVLALDRESLLVRARELGLRNDRDYFAGLPPLGRLPNLQSASGDPLVLKPEYGGSTLSSAFTHVPAGYRGVAIDGVAPLIANAGTYDLGLAPTAVGGLSQLTAGARQLSGMVAVRRDMTPWLQAYVELSGNRTTTTYNGSLTPRFVTLAADAPNNPFTEDLLIATPFPGTDQQYRAVNSQVRGLIGAVAKLPYEWQAVLDLTIGRSTNSGQPSAPGFTRFFLDSLGDGGVDVLRDPALNPLPYDYIASRYGTFNSAGITRQRTLTLRMAGPLPLKLPGGAVKATVSVERNTDKLDGTIAVTNDAFASSIFYTGPRSQRIDAIYGELAIPILGNGKTLPLVQELSLTLAARAERYVGRGSGQLECFYGLGTLPSDDLVGQCPPAGGSNPIGTTRNSSTNPSISARWVTVPGVMLRGSYATGYVPPRLDQLVRLAVPYVGTDALDPLRGNEPIGQPSVLGVNALPGFVGGNPDIKPQTSKSWSAGVVLTPKFAEGLRLSADWTRTVQRNNYINIASLAFSDGIDAVRRAFLDFLAANPGRFPRGPASGGYPVGPIQSLDLSLANLAGLTSEAVDFVGDYSHELGSGTLSVGGRATYVAKLAVQELPTDAPTEYAGVVNRRFITGEQPLGAPRWRGVGHVRWANDRLSLGWQTRFFSGYFLNPEHNVLPSQGSARVRREIFHDLTGSYVLGQGATMRLSITNVLDTPPAIDTATPSAPYSQYGDPRGAIYSISLVKAF